MILNREQDGSFRWRAGTLLLIVGAMWIVFGIDSLSGGRVRFLPGIVPRSQEGLAGIVTAPFVHLDLDHLVTNTIPLLVLGALVLLGGVNRFLTVFAITGAIAGAGTWLIGSPRSIHIGASGIIFGLLGYLLFRSVFDRRISSFVVTLLVAVGYGGALTTALIPSAGVSWSGHLSGFIGGFLAARFLHARPPAPLRRTGDPDLDRWADGEVRRWMDELEKRR